MLLETLLTIKANTQLNTSAVLRCLKIASEVCHTALRCNERYIAPLTDPLQSSYVSVDSIAKSNYITVIMEYDEGKVDEMVLALLHLTSFNEQGFTRAWKGHDWDAL